MKLINLKDQHGRTVGVEVPRTPAGVAFSITSGAFGWTLTAHKSGRSFSFHNGQPGLAPKWEREIGMTWPKWALKLRAAIVCITWPCFDL